MGGGAENASTGKHKYEKCKYETAHCARMENACLENASVVNVVHFQVGWESGLQIVFFLR